MVATVTVPLAVASQLPEHDRSIAAKALSLSLIALSFLLLALLAPLVGARRRDVLWGLVPFWIWKIAWTFGTELVRLPRTARWQQNEPKLDRSHS